jgi:DNA-binding CsgD family transcriptional regulator
MNSLGRLDPEAFAALEPETLFALALVGLVLLLRPYFLPTLARSKSDFGLTSREVEVLAWVAAGKTNAETAELLSIAPGTVKKHLDHIYEKLDVGTRTEAVLTAMGMSPSVGASAPRALRP